MEILGYRAFQKLSLPHLSRVNLFVGKNNSGKTSLLEAAHILATGGNIESILTSIIRRSEFLTDAYEDGIRPETKSDPDLCRLFHGHQLGLGDSFTLSSFNGSKLNVRCQVVKLEEAEGSESVFEESEAGIVEMPKALEVTISPGMKPEVYQISPAGGLVRNFNYRPISGSAIKRKVSPFVGNLSSSQVIPVEGLNLRRMGRLWESVALTPQESEVIRALQIVEPKLEKLAFVGQSTAFVKFKDLDNRYPLGSMGDGIKRLLGLALVLTVAKDGYVIIDEVDTGLHYSTMVDMWKLIVGTARTLNFQVFATTHSQDCLRALARLHLEAPEWASEVSVHRIEKAYETSTVYSASELLTAAQTDIDLR